MASGRCVLLLTRFWQDSMGRAAASLGVLRRQQRWGGLLLPMLALLLLLLPEQTLAVIVGAAVLPHGDFALDPSLIHYRNGSLAVHRACEDAAAWIKSLRPERVVMSTPHGLELSEAWALYLNGRAQGSARIGQDLHDPSITPYEVAASASLDPGLTSALLSDALARVPALTALQGFADSQPLPLGWAEVVPLSLLRDVVNSTQLVVLSHPLRRYNHSKDMIPELLELGAAMAGTLQAVKERVVVVISADLAHTHSADGPYGYSPAAQPFDRACGRWAASLEEGPLLEEAAALAQQARSCGYTGLVLLHGMLQAGGSWRSKLLANEAPTYYGMMTAIFQPTDDAPPEEQEAEVAVEARRHDE